MLNFDGLSKLAKLYLRSLNVLEAALSGEIESISALLQLERSMFTTHISAERAHDSSISEI